MIHVWSGTPECIQVFPFEQRVVLVSGVLVQLVPSFVRHPAGAHWARKLETGFQMHLFVMLLGLVLIAHDLITQFAFAAKRKVVEKLAVKVHKGFHVERKRGRSSTHQIAALS